MSKKKCTGERCPMNHTCDITVCTLWDECGFYTPACELDKKTIDILGTKYNIMLISENEDQKLKKCDAYCDNTVKRIVVDNYLENTDEMQKSNLKRQNEKNIRHEIIHAFLYESGLAENSDWAMCEEMIDWFAMQGLKIFKAWEEAGVTTE